MKRTLKTLFLVIFAYGCNASNNTVEDKLFDCLVAEYKNQGIDILPLLDSLENYYINNGILNDKSGQAKLDFYKKIALDGKVPTMASYNIADSVGQIKFFQAEIDKCISTNGIDSLTLKKSNYYKLMEEFKSMNEVNPKNAAVSHTRILTSSDFEHPYYRAHMLITFTRIYERERAFIRENE
jgi:hypothetical protein